MTTLISFLGKSKQDPKSGYRTATYDFNGVHKTTPYFGLALTKIIQSQRLILIGTSGSMWDVFFEHSEAKDEHVLALIDAVAENRVTEQLLEPCLPFLQKKLGCTVECLVIDYAAEEAEQIDLLLALAERLDNQEHISLDVTHSFRHLPMLALIAARYLHTVKDIITDNIYYGALEMTKDKITPVIELKGLLKMLEWTDALASYDKDGDYHPFAKLYQAEGQTEAAQALAQAAFYEKTNQIGQARKPLKQFRAIDIVTPINSLFIDELNRRTDWVDSEKFALRQLQMAQHYLEKNNYLRAAILGREAFLYHLAQVYKTDKEEARDILEKSIKNSKKSNQCNNLHDAYEDLRFIRNALAHATSVKTPNLQSAFANSEKLHHIMQNSLNTIFHAIETGQTT